MILLLFIFGVIGMTHILVDSEIMAPIDEWSAQYLPENVHHGLFGCYQCCGFWCGVVLCLFLISVNPFVVFSAGCAGSFLANIGCITLDWLEDL